MVSAVIALYQVPPSQNEDQVRSYHLLAFVLAMSIATVGQEHQGLIRGTVVADDGLPVADAHVSADVMKTPSVILTVLDANTDSNGAFTFQNLGWGEYHLSAQKDEDQYLSTRPDGFNSRKPLTVVLTQEHPAESVLIKFGSKGAIITGWVKDAETDRPISASLRIIAISGSAYLGIGTSGKYKFRQLLFPNTPVYFEVISEGYEPWFYSDPSYPTRRAILNLEPGSVSEFDIKLRRIKVANDRQAISRVPLEVNDKSSNRTLSRATNQMTLERDPVDFVIRAFLGAIGLVLAGSAVVSRGEFRWGRGGQGPRIEPQWVGRALFAIVGSILLYAAITGFE